MKKMGLDVLQARQEGKCPGNFSAPWLETSLTIMATPCSVTPAMLGSW
jgi:hypothetical protein